jgi:hypothetical protein
MRAAVLVGVAMLSIGTAWAQNGGSEIVIPPAPPLTPEVPTPPAPPQPPAQQPPPGLVPVAPSSPAEDTAPTAPPSPGAPPANAAAQPPPPDVAPSQPNNWTPGTTAVLGVLNKVDGSTAELTVPVGAQAQTTGDLSVSVQACLSRPSGQIPDFAIFLTVAPTQQGAAPLYQGWMVRSAPGATFVGNAGQTFRVIGCS